MATHALKLSTLLLIGLDGSGKTTFLKRYKDLPADSVELICNTPFMNIQNITLPISGQGCALIEVAGAGRYREYWQNFYVDADGIFFFIDTTDVERLSIVQDLLHEIANHPDLQGREIPIVLLANKQDKMEKLDKADIKRILHLDKIKSGSSMLWAIKNASGLTGLGFAESLEFFDSNK